MGTFWGNSSLDAGPGLAASSGRPGAAAPDVGPVPALAETRLSTVLRTPLSGCPDSLYAAMVLVGRDQVADVAIDLGHGALLLPDRSCTSCPDAWGYDIRYSLGAEPQGTNATLAGTTFRAEVENVVDDVAFAGARTIALELGVMVAGENIYRPDRCRLPAAALAPAGAPLAAPSPSPTTPAGLGGAIALPMAAAGSPLHGPPPNALYRGLMGMGRQSLDDLGAAGPPSAWFDALTDQLPRASLALALCDRGGVLFVGGFPEEHVVAPPFRTPMVGQPRYAVAMTGAAVGGVDLALDRGELGISFLATDDPYLRLPTGPLAHLVGAIEGAAGGLLPAGFLRQSACHRLGGLSGAQLRDTLPTLSLHFDGGTLRLPSTNSYLELLVSAEGAEVGVCPRLAASHSANVSLGLTMLRNLVTLVDVEAGQIGFAVGRGLCGPA